MAFNKRNGLLVHDTNATICTLRWNKPLKQDIEAGLHISSRLEAVWEEYDMREGAFWLAEFLQSPESKQYPLCESKGFVRAEQASCMA